MYKSKIFRWRTPDSALQGYPSSKEKLGNIGVILDQDKNIGPILLLLGEGKGKEQRGWEGREGMGR
jgi:hypothetical protein